MRRVTTLIMTIAIAMLCGTVQAQAPGTTHSIEIRNTTSLSFGSFASPAAGGLVSVSPDGTRTMSGLVPVGTNTFNAASFEVRVSGQGNPNYNITLPSTITISGPSGTMTIANVQSLPASTGHANPPARVETLTVGGTLTINPMQAAGSYTGVFPVTINLVN